MLTPKQMLQGLPVALTQVKASNTSVNLLQEIREMFLRIVKHLILTDYYSIFRVKWT